MAPHTEQNSTILEVSKLCFCTQLLVPHSQCISSSLHNLWQGFPMKRMMNVIHFQKQSFQYHFLIELGQCNVGFHFCLLLWILLWFFCFWFGNKAVPLLAPLKRPILLLLLWRLKTVGFCLWIFCRCLWVFGKSPALTGSFLQPFCDDKIHRRILQWIGWVRDPPNTQALHLGAQKSLVPHKHGISLNEFMAKICDCRFVIERHANPRLPWASDQKLS